MAISFFRILVAENPFLRFVDYYQNFYVNAGNPGDRHTVAVIEQWLNNRNDKLSKDKKSVLGKTDKEELYFQISDLEEGVLTFRQFINFIVKGTREAVGTKV